MVAYARTVLRKTPRTLRETETNRVVKEWEEEDQVIYEWLLVQGSELDRSDGVVPGESWGERGWVYASPVPAEPHS